MARPKLEYVPTGESRALIYKIDRDLWPVYHYHPEIDIILILKNHGEFISGDYIGRMEPGTLIMNGPNIPHALHAVEEDEPIIVLESMKMEIPVTAPEDGAVVEVVVEEEDSVAEGAVVARIKV